VVGNFGEMPISSIPGFTALVLTLAAIAGGARCEGLRFESVEAGRREFAVFVGYGENHRIPSDTKDRFAFDTLKARVGYFTSPRNQWTLDVSVGSQTAGQDNSAVWVTATRRHLFLVRGRTAVSWDVSLGIIRFRDEVPSQATRTNFTEQLGLTLQYGITESTALDLGYAFSHISNAGIRLPNLGINASVLSVGWSWFL